MSLNSSESASNTWTLNHLQPPRNPTNVKLCNKSCNDLLFYKNDAIFIQYSFKYNCTIFVWTWLIYTHTVYIDILLFMVIHTVHMNTTHTYTYCHTLYIWVHSVLVHFYCFTLLGSIIMLLFGFCFLILVVVFVILHSLCSYCCRAAVCWYCWTDWRSTVTIKEILFDSVLFYTWVLNPIMFNPCLLWLFSSLNFTLVDSGLTDLQKPTVGSVWLLNMDQH